MAAKTYQLYDVQVDVYKRRDAKNIRISVVGTGAVRVTIPFWTPYATGLAFAKSKLVWIRAHAPKPAMLTNGQAIGKNHTLLFVQQPSSKKVSTRVSTTTVMIGLPPNIDSAHLEVQKSAKAAATRALKKQAQELLPLRLQTLANEHNFAYKSLGFKPLKSRWGSCDQHQNIIMNIYVMQLPWQCIDYVLLHELVHTKVMHHGADFWELFEKVLPRAKAYRKILRKYQPVIMPALDL